MNPLIKSLANSSNYSSLIKQISKEDKNRLSIVGLTDSSKAWMLYGITQNTNKSSIVVCSNIFQVNKIMQDLKFYATDIEIVYLPARNLQYYDIEAESKDIANQRMYAIERILSGKRIIVVTTIDSLLVKMFPNTRYRGEEFTLKVGDSIEINKVVEKLAKFGFERSENVEGKGQFAVRGGIIDLFCINNDLPYRIEFFGDEVDSIRTFDPITQRSIDTVKKIDMSQVSENYVTQEKVDTVLSELKKYAHNEELNSELRANIKNDIEKIKDGALDNLVDKYFNLLVKRPDTLLDYLTGFNIFIDEPTRCREKANNIGYENVETIKVLAQRDYIYMPFVNSYLSYEEIETKIENEMSSIYMERINIDKVVLRNRVVYNFSVKEANFYKSSMEILTSDLIKSKDKAVLLVFPTDTRYNQIKNYLQDNQIRVEEVSNIFGVDELDIGKVYITKGILSGGFVSEEFEVLVIAEPVSGLSTTSKKIKKTSTGQKINTYADLQVGDYVVHENHGIGIYRGIETVRVEDVQKDYIKIEYSDKGMLYVPINQLDCVGKYVCDDGAKPKINSLGTKEWEKTKTKVKAHVKEMAKELMLLYAKREKMKGFMFSKDTPWQREFEDSFEYELTKDQRTSLEEIKEDMETDKPMDRLLCGDVGYGKTELALRAAFKAVMDSKQVAYLVPTTVLALQQYRTFSNRMKEFGIKVELLSRVKTKKEQTEILKKLVDGEIDIIVGTHRILSKDVFFKDLGLLIIDEEHRFGVKDKEKIKALKESIDVLSMTATPIPRTLHMSMIGIRGMSTLTEPPMERLPVHTYVLEYNDHIIKEAIEKELLRDGQIIYLNNRVSAIDEITMRLRNMVPQARVASAHGQMPPEMVEDVMLKFINHEIDIIVCTTILESGIDVANANTLIVEDADTLGLAQLYQIRGRVGRSNRLAYAYITYEANKSLPEVSQKRLKAIKDFTEFGSGFKIALRDLEIRGAGNLLGKEQHGHMAKVGYELYLALLEKAIREEKEGKDVTSKEEIAKEVKIDINVSAYISDMYIKDPIQKIDMYQKISDIKNEEESMEIVDELLDRFGDIPKETENLIKIVEIRNKARKLGITRIYANDKMVKFEPMNLKFALTNSSNNDILIRVQLEISKLENTMKEKG
ncbi:MAG: transcription-repair coupling factor [Clostridia bacterium]|nr:transcription-repair coupling factor [Clostridia bacterium]